MRVSIIVVMLMLISVVLITNNTLFFGMSSTLRIFISTGMLLGPLLMAVTTKKGSWLCFLFGLYITIGGFSLLDGGSLAEISAATKADMPTNFNIYLTLSLAVLYDIIAGTAILINKRRKI
jgi:hypothetical protein